MAILTPAQKKELGQPPRAPGPSVAIANAQGLPSEAFTTYMTQLDAWMRKLTKILGT